MHSVQYSTPVTSPSLCNSKTKKFAINKLSLKIPTHLKHVGTLPDKILMSEIFFCFSLSAVPFDGE